MIKESREMRLESKQFVGVISYHYIREENSLLHTDHIQPIKFNTR